MAIRSIAEPRNGDEEACRSGVLSPILGSGHEASDVSPRGRRPHPHPAAGGGRPRDLVGARGRASQHGAGAPLSRPLPDRGGGSRGRDLAGRAEGARDLPRSRVGRPPELLRAGSARARRLSAVADGGPRGFVGSAGAEPPAPAREPAAERGQARDVPAHAPDRRAAGLGSGDRPRRRPLGDLGHAPLAPGGKDPSHPGRGHDAGELRLGPGRRRRHGRDDRGSQGRGGRHHRGPGAAGGHARERGLRVARPRARRGGVHGRPHPRRRDRLHRVQPRQVVALHGGNRGPARVARGPAPPVALAAVRGRGRRARALPRSHAPGRPTVRRPPAPAHRRVQPRSAAARRCRSSPTSPSPSSRG